MAHPHHDEVIDQFLRVHGFSQMDYMIPVKGDASLRSYARYINGAHSTILMDARNDKENFLMFVNIAGYLRAQQLNAPHIYAYDAELGLMLLEDFGDGNYGKLLPDTDQEAERELYTHATDVLLRLHESPLPGFDVPAYHSTRLMKELHQFTEWYLPQMVKDPKRLEDVSQSFVSIWEDLLATLSTDSAVVVLRDYHSPNLMWLPDRPGIRRVGILDFQDAVLGSKAYDLVSLIEDARYDIGDHTMDVLLDHYLTHAPSVDKEPFLQEFALLGAQRNCKIIGFLTRKLIRDQNSNYLHLYARMWRYLNRDMKHPMLAPLALWFDQVIPQELRSLDGYLKAVG